MRRARKLTLEPEGELMATFVNPGEWFKKRRLIGVGCGFWCQFYIVEADHEEDAIDKLTDSEWGYILKTDDMCDVCLKAEEMENPPEGSWDECTCDFAGNYSERVDLDNIRVLRRLT